MPEMFVGATSWSPLRTEAANPTVYAMTDFARQISLGLI